MNKHRPCVIVFWEDGYFLKTHFSLHRSEMFVQCPVSLVIMTAININIKRKYTGH